MSFLNPVNEPVLRFKSTDAGAPQINYNARTAGDVKAVLKACLVTGYGSVASAGWSIINEIDHVCEFVSPSAAMSDYRLGIDDSTATKTDWYYQYQNTRFNPTNNASVKALTNINKTHADNGWQLFVTARGLYFVEIVYNTFASAIATRVTAMTQCKLAINNSGVNMSYFCAGQNGSSTYPSDMYSSALHSYFAISNLSCVRFGFVDSKELANADILRNVSNVDIISKSYIAATGRVFVGEQAGMLSLHQASNVDLYGVKDVTIDSKNYCKICIGTHYGNTANIANKVLHILIPTDFWEY